MAVELTHKQAVNREKDIQDELERLKAKTDKTPEDMAQVAPLLDEFRTVHAHRLDLEHDAALSEIRAASLPTGSADDETARVDRRPTGELDIVDRTRSAEFIAGKYRNPWDTSEMRVGFGDSVASELKSRACDAIERMEFADDKVREAATRFVERDGEDDTPIAKLVLGTSSPDYGKAFSRMIPQARFAIVEQAGHYPHLEQPAKFLSLVQDFL